VRYTPERLQALADTAIAHEELGFGLDKEAVAHMQEAIKLFPDSPVTHFYLGEALSRKDPVAAKAAYRKAAELGDNQTRAVVDERLGTAK
jgi:Flp pilus assembly protein TadD